MSQVIVGTGLPEAVHSKLTSVPFLTTIFPSSGLGLILGGTEKFKKWRKRLITRFSWKRAGNTTLRYLNFFTIVCASVLLLLLKNLKDHNTLSFHFFCCGTKRLKCFPRDVLLQGQRKLLLACNCRHNDHLYCKSVWFRKIRVWLEIVSRFNLNCQSGFYISTFSLLF